MKELRLIAVAEATTLLLLVCVAVPLKHLADTPGFVSVMGPVHGLTFLVFVWFVVRSWAEGLIGATGAFRLLLGALVPLGGFINERWLRNLQLGST